MIPEYRRTNARYRGPKESVKMNLFTSNVDWNIQQLKKILSDTRKEIEEVHSKRDEQDVSLIRDVNASLTHIERRMNR